METAYVGNSVSAENASTTVGTEVIKAVAQKYQTNNQIGKANIEIEDFGTIENVTGDATVTVSTTDFEIEGTITLNDGILTWNEIVPNTPRIKLNRKDIALAPGAKLYACHTKYDIDDFKEFKGEVVASRTNPALLGLKNSSGSTWQAILPNGTSKDYPDGQVVKLGKGIKINFGHNNKGEIN